MALILVVDDDVQSRQLYVSLLTPFGHQVIEAGDGKEGLEQARLRKPDLIISDILMPTMNGYEFVSALRKYPTLENVPVVFHSASFLDQETRSLGGACGVSLFITKPCEPERALAIVQEALGLEIQKPAAPAPIQTGGDAIPLLLDAFFEKGKQLDAVSIRLASLLELGLDLAHSCSLDELMDKAGKAARKFVGANYSGVGILAGDGPHLRSFAFFGGDPEVAAKFSHPVFDGPIFREIVSERKARRAFSPSGEPARLELPVCHPPVRGFLGVPLATGDRVSGWIYVADKLATLEFTEEDSRILTALAAQFALAFENAERFRTTQEHAHQLETEIEERKRAEDRFHVLVETAPTGIVIADERGRIAEVNAQALRMFGYDRGELIGKTVETLLPERLRSSHQEHRSGYMKEPHARPMGVGMELFARRKDGTEFPTEISLGPLVTKEGVLISSTIVDITERKKMEERFRLSRRLEAIGKLAGGVAHDFNNLLGVILGQSEILLDRAKDQASTHGLEMIRESARRGAALTRQLLAFGRRQVLEIRVVNLNMILADVEKLLRRVIGDDVELEFQTDAKLGSIEADPGQLEQVIVNLAINARDAMPKGGKLTIATANLHLDEAYADRRAVVKPGRYVQVVVSDTGCGMDEQTQSRIFEPFFTTKEQGKGTGVGLATAYGIVKQSGGYIWVYSEPGHGTIFKIYFPMVEAAAESPQHVERIEELPRGSETILVVEDDASLREVTCEFLQNGGYVVIPAGSPEEALQLAERHDGPIHFLLTDVIMPKLNGRELATKLSKARPEMKILYVSGYADGIVRDGAHGALEEGLAFLQKPYTRHALVRKIREVLDSQGVKSAANVGMNK